MGQDYAQRRRPSTSVISTGLTDELTRLRQESFDELVNHGWLPVQGHWIVVVREADIPLEKGPDYPRIGTVPFAPAWFHAALRVYGFPERYDLKVILKVESSQKLFEELCDWLRNHSHKPMEQYAMLVESLLLGYMDPVTHHAHEYLLAQA